MWQSLRISQRDQRALEGDCAVSRGGYRIPGCLPCEHVTCEECKTERFAMGRDECPQCVRRLFVLEESSIPVVKIKVSRVALVRTKVSTVGCDGGRRPNSKQ